VTAPQPRRILVADDNRHALAAMVRMLEGVGYQVTSATGGREALEAARDVRPDLALLDVMMPDLTGTAVLREIRADPELADMMVLLVSAKRAGPDDQALGLDSGADGYIARPVEEVELLARVRAALRQHELQTKLRNSEARLRHIITHQPDAVLVVDGEGMIRFANPAAGELLGRSPEKLVGEPFGVPLEAAPPSEIDLPGHGDGGRTAELLVVPTSWGDEESCLVTLRDVTFRREAERSIREQAALVSKAQDAILVLNLDHEITFWNRSAERLYGWRVKEAIGRSVDSLLFTDAGPFRSAVSQVLDRGEWSGEFDQVDKDGHTFTVEGRWTLMHDDRQRPSHILAIHTDVTDKKRLLAQILRAQRTESIGTLASGIAHDLNNVLTPILMSVEHLKAELDVDEDARQTLDIIGASARRGADLVRQVLSFSRGGQGSRTAIDLGAVLEELASVVRDTFPKSITYRWRMSGSLPQLEGDPTQLHQVLLNLLVNARDAMPDGGEVELTVEEAEAEARYTSSESRSEPGAHLRFRVTDTGIGMPREVLEQIFDPFYTTKEVGSGTGLGLFTVAAIVKGHGGYLNVTSEEGVGTTFEVYLPATHSATRENPASQESGRGGPLTGTGELILIVDDDDAVRRITKRTLEASGYRVTAASDGMEAMTLFAESKDDIALVITDMMMPVMDGNATIRAIRSIDPHVPILAVSGLGSKEIGHDMDGVEFLAKPYTGEMLRAAAHRLLAGRGHGDPAG
jgi:two-component system, cell cycle sensor histidine kinase and response regulator CckA